MTCESEGNSEKHSSPYDRVFVLAFLSNLSLMTAVSLLFRYSDFVRYSGGDEYELGWITGIGTTGAIASRLFQGAATDRFGANIIWVVSLACYFVAVLWHVRIENVNGIEVYLARLLMTMSLAGSFGASLTFISLRAPVARSAEIIGVLGSSGFLGMGLGPQIGDWLFRNVNPDSTLEASTIPVQRMFYVSSAIVVVAFVSALLAGLLAGKTRKSHSLNILRAVLKYHPGVLMLIAGAMGLGISMPMVFLKPYCDHLGIGQIGTFFLAYNIIAFSLRILTRKIPDRIGHHNAVLIGMVGLAASMPCYLLVTNWFGLIVPAIVAGIAHAFLFPSVVASAGIAFPDKYRGVATNLILAWFDIGVFLGMPMVGGILEFSRQYDLAAYPTMFWIVASVLGGSAIIYSKLHAGFRRN